MERTIAGIDVHKKVLMAVVVRTAATGSQPVVSRCRFGALAGDLAGLRAWLAEQGVSEVVMESTAQYWKPVWMELEPFFKLHLAQAYSNRAPRGRKNDFRDAERLARRFTAGELVLSLVPDPEQRGWRTMSRMKVQLTEDRSRLHSQLEALLEEMRIKLSSVVSDLLGVSSRSILQALAQGQTDAAQLAACARGRLRCPPERLIDALRGCSTPMHRRLLGLYLERLEMVQQQIDELHRMIALAMQPHQDAVQRLAEVPGFGADSAQQIIAEVGPQARAFDSAPQFSSWAGTCPGKQESAEQNKSSRSAKGNRYLRRVLTEAAQAAVKVNGGHYQNLFRRLLPRLGYKQALWAVVHRLCRLVWKILHEQVGYIEQGADRDPKAIHRRTRNLTRALQRLGYTVTLQPNPSPMLAR